MELLQTISLFILLNMTRVPKILIAYFRSLEITTFKFIPNAFDLLPINFTQVTDSNKNYIIDNSKYHPGIFFMIQLLLKKE